MCLIAAYTIREQLGHSVLCISVYLCYFPSTMLTNCLTRLILIILIIPKSQSEEYHPQNSKPNPDAPAILYLPLGGGGVNECEPAVGAKLTQLVPLMFAGMTFTIFDAVANINNRINSNNNNNNNQNINFQQSVNTVVSGNVNVANQINVMNVAGRKKRSNKKGSRISKEHKKAAAAIAKKGMEALISLNKVVDDRLLHQMRSRQHLDPHVLI